MINDIGIMSVIVKNSIISFQKINVIKKHTLIRSITNLFRIEALNILESHSLTLSTPWLYFSSSKTVRFSNSDRLIFFRLYS